MIINFEKLEEVQRKHDSALSEDVLRQLLGIILQFDNNHAAAITDANWLTAYATLKQLGVIYEVDPNKKPEMLNS